MWYIYSSAYLVYNNENDQTTEKSVITVKSYKENVEYKNNYRIIFKKCMSIQITFFKFKNLVYSINSYT